MALSHKFYEHHQTKISDFIAIKVFLLAGTLPWFLWKLSYVLLGIEVYLLLHTFWRQATD
jgi:NADH-quinone oxidoreductase subunit N